ncbi:MAG: hypothetical protein QXP04_05405 [Candidatus Nanoarchaeia archaeon]|nr:hypothetical protein [Candidatus Jingweiarchaeum tengchongense]
MEYTQLLELFKILGTASIALIIWLIIKEISILLKNKNQNDIENRVSKIEKMISNDTRHELESLWIEVREVRNDLDKFKDDIHKQLISIEKHLVILDTKKYGNRERI